VAGGEMTPKLSLKRRVILEKFSKDIESIYAE
jgi:long-subunit acyl-CoA synthetase (AMP-forming)